MISCRLKTNSWCVCEAEMRMSVWLMRVVLVQSVVALIVQLLVAKLVFACLSCVVGCASRGGRCAWTGGSRSDIGIASPLCVCACGVPTHLNVQTVCCSLATHKYMVSLLQDKTKNAKITLLVHVKYRLKVTHTHTHTHTHTLPVLWLICGYNKDKLLTLILKSSIVYLINFCYANNISNIYTIIEVYSSTYQLQIDTSHRY